MFKATFALILALICAGFGNLMLSKGMQAVGPLQEYQFSALFHYFVDSVTNPWVVTGIFLELAYFLLWLVVLSWADVSWAVPMNAVEYVFVALLANVYLGESIPFNRWVGIALISVGVLFLMRSWAIATAAVPEEPKEMIDEQLT
ncbi:MAG: EamA family transporter [Deltaproteobacteria bacterium]|nr:EamA family transporter [Deltaproteobacteria bacterium]MDZ4224892.1 EamA family transporter [bacterium]